MMGVSVISDPAAGKLTEKDREVFLRGRGLTPSTSPAAAAVIRGQWPDRDILEAIEVGLG